MNPIGELIAICEAGVPGRLFATRMCPLPREECALLDTPLRL
jgi:hypothetical protein